MHNRLESCHPNPFLCSFSFFLVPAKRQMPRHMELPSPLLLGPCSEVLGIVGEISVLLTLGWYHYWENPVGAVCSTCIHCACIWPVSPPTCTFLSCLFPDFIWYSAAAAEAVNTKISAGYFLSCKTQRKQKGSGTLGGNGGISTQLKYMKDIICVLQSWEKGNC